MEAFAQAADDAARGVGPGGDARGGVHALGVTTAYEAHVMDLPLIEAYRLLRSDLSRQGDRVARSRVLRAGIDEPIPRRSSRRACSRRLRRERTDEILRVDGVTVSRGGPCWPGFMLMREPYKAPMAN